MALTEQKIRQNCEANTFRRGKNLYKNGDVEEIIIDRDLDNGIVYLNGKVLGKEEPFYEVSVDLDEFRNYEATSYRCQCEAYRTYPGFCKHLVALQLEYIKKENLRMQEAIQKKKDSDVFDKNVRKGIDKEKYPMVNDFLDFLEDVEKIKKKQQNEAKPSEIIQNETKEEQLRRLLGMNNVTKGFAKKKVKTDKTITRMLERIAKDVQEQIYQGDSLKEKMEIEPYLTRTYGYNSFQVSFRVGAKKKYIVKSVEEFVGLVENREYHAYGKNLAFVHTRENFAPASLPLLDFLSDYVNMKEQGAQRSFYYHPSTKEISLNAVLFEKLMLAIEEGERIKGTSDHFTSHIMLHSGNKGEYFYLKKENPRFTVVLESVEEGAFLRFPEFDILLGNTEMYLVDANQIYHCKGEYARELRILMEQLANGNMQELFIAKQDLQSVCASIMPLLQKYFDVEEQEISIAEYQPPEVEFWMYLDDDKEIGVTCRVECQYGSKKYRIFQETDASAYRDLIRENAMIQVLEKYFTMARRKNSDFMITDEDKLYELLADGINELNQLGTVMATEAFRKNGIRQTPGVELGVSIKSDLLDLSLQSEQLPYEELDEILNSYKLRKRYHRLKDGQFLELEDSSLSVLSELADGLELSGKDLKKGNIVLPKHRALFIDAVLRDAGEQVHVRRDNLFKGLIRNIKNVEDSDYEIPEQQYAILRSYQKKGYRWLRTLHDYGFGGILADDMGLGKTLQIITLLQSIKEEWQQNGAKKNTRLALVVCPASLVYNWQSEIEKFAPALKVAVIAGSAPERKSQIKEAANADVCITSYDLLKRDVNGYKDCHFEIHVIDEAQYIKNASTQAAKAVKGISSNTRIALTGTPIENRLSELWSIFDFLMPGLLFSYKHFKEELETGIINGTNGEGQGDEKAVTRLKNMVRPFILRRLKEDVLKDLPKKLENVVHAKMEGEQLKLYEARVQNLKRSLEKQTNDEFKTNKIQILAELTRLRQICCDPALCYEDYQGGSAKFDLCMEMLVDAVNSGHKILLFSQFTTMLDRIAEKLDKEKISYYILTGETKKERRVDMANAFNENEVPIFLISLRAGGTGLNLVGADMVIHFDPWWNLAAQNQATDRAHRIGQKNVVTVFKMITDKSIEEKILALQEKKKNLADQIISDEGMSEGSLTREDLLEILS